MFLSKLIDPTGGQSISLTFMQFTKMNGVGSVQDNPAYRGEQGLIMKRIQPGTTLDSCMKLERFHP